MRVIITTKEVQASVNFEANFARLTQYNLQPLQASHLKCAKFIVQCVCVNVCVYNLPQFQSQTNNNNEEEKGEREFNERI